MVMLNNKDKKKKQIFFKILKEYNASFLFKEYFLKTHNNNITFDEFIKKDTNKPIYNILLRAFDWSNIDNPDLWHNIHHEMVKYEFGKFVNNVVIKNKVTKEISPLQIFSSPF